VANTAVSGVASGLKPNSTYYYRLVATNGAGTTAGNEQTFKTLAIPPSVTTNPAASITTNAAMLSGTVNANNATTSDIHFELTTTSGSYASPKIVQSTPASASGLDGTAVSGAASGLIPNTTYYYRLVATNVAGTTAGNEQTFKTLAAPPSVITKPATNVKQTSATLNGTVNANNATTTEIHFELRTANGTYSSLGALPTNASGTTDTPVSFNASGLMPGTTYYFRLVATNIAGTTVGAELRFRTAERVTDYNLFVLNTLTFSNGAVQGRVAAGGSATLASLSQGTGLSNSNGTRDDLIVGGDLNFKSGTVLNGNIVYSGTATLSSVTILHGSARQVSDPIAVAATQSYITSVSANWAALPANGATSVKYSGSYAAITLTGSGSQPKQFVFVVSGADLAKANSIKISVPSGSTVIINVSGTADKLQSASITLTGADAQHVVWNFHQATSLSIKSVAFQGTIWAPLADITIDSGAMSGAVIGKSLNTTSTSYILAQFAGALP
jgi:choice-of-anchor A domain-containing protein